MNKMLVDLHSGVTAREFHPTSLFFRQKTAGHLKTIEFYEVYFNIYFYLFSRYVVSVSKVPF